MHQNVHLETVIDDLETLVIDTNVLEVLTKDRDPNKKSKEIEIKLVARLRKHQHNLVFIALSERLEQLKTRHEQGRLHSIDFLKVLLDLAREMVRA